MLFEHASTFHGSVVLPGVHSSLLKWPVFCLSTCLAPLAARLLPLLWRSCWLPWTRWRFWLAVVGLGLYAVYQLLCLGVLRQAASDAQALPVTPVYRWCLCICPTATLTVTALPPRTTRASSSSKKTRAAWRTPSTDSPTAQPTSLLLPWWHSGECTARPKPAPRPIIWACSSPTTATTWLWVLHPTGLQPVRRPAVRG